MRDRVARLWRQPDTLPLLAILAVAAALRLLLASGQRLIRWDEPDYLTLGINIFAGKGYTTGMATEIHHAPFFPIVSGVFYVLVRNAELASNIVYVIAGTLLIVPAFAITRRIYGPRVALIAAALLSVYPALSASVLYWGTMTEPLYILLVFSAFYCGIVAVEDDRPWAFGSAGVFLSLAYLTRPEASVDFLILLAVFVLFRLAQRRLFTRAAFGRLALYVAAFVLIAAPYIGFLYAETGHLMISGKLGITYAMGQAVLNRDMASYDRKIASLDSTGKQIVWYSPDRFNYSISADLMSDPKGFVQRIFANARLVAADLFSRLIFPTLLGIPLLLGLMKVAWDRQRLQRELYLVAMALPVLSFLIFHVEIRFFSPAFPVLLIWAAHGLDDLGEWLASTAGNLVGHRRTVGVGRGLMLLPVAVTLLYFIFMLPRAVSAGTATLDMTHRAAGQWLAENTPAESVVMSRDLAIALYAGRPWVVSPNAEYADVMKYARHHGVGYYVVDTNEVNSLRPQLKMLLGDPLPPELVLEKTLPQANGQGNGRTLIFRLKALIAK